MPAIIDALCEKVQYRDHLEKLQGPDAKERFLNVEELKVSPQIRLSWNFRRA